MVRMSSTWFVGHVRITPMKTLPGVLQAFLVLAYGDYFEPLGLRHLHGRPVLLI